MLANRVNGKCRQIVLTTMMFACIAVMCRAAEPDSIEPPSVESVRALLQEQNNLQMRFDWSKVEKLPKAVVPILIAEFRRYKNQELYGSPPDVVLRHYTLAGNINRPRLTNTQIISFWQQWWTNHKSENRHLWKAQAFRRCTALLPKHKDRAYYKKNYQEFRGICHTLALIPENVELLIEAGAMARTLSQDALDNVVRAIGWTRNQQGTPFVIECIESDGFKVEWAAIVEALPLLADKRSIGPLVDYVNTHAHKNEYCCCSTAIDTLSRIGSPRLRHTFRNWIVQDRFKAIRHHAIIGFSRIAMKDDISDLISWRMQLPLKWKRKDGLERPRYNEIDRRLVAFDDEALPALLRFPDVSDADSRALQADLAFSILQSKQEHAEASDHQVQPYVSLLRVATDRTEISRTVQLVGRLKSKTATPALLSLYLKHRQGHSNKPISDICEALRRIKDPTCVETVSKYWYSPPFDAGGPGGCVGRGRMGVGSMEILQAITGQNLPDNQTLWMEWLAKNWPPKKAKEH
ncbi:MAG: hypothetical protein FVQ85_19915 [Planctomycetes bacterium]|nr:hypothetical protein [Planctomycetota bacterium]